jgi:hypothetical protein
MVVVQTDSTGRMIQDVIMREMGTERGGAPSEASGGKSRNDRPAAIGLAGCDLPGAEPWWKVRPAEPNWARLPRRRAWGRLLMRVACGGAISILFRQSLIHQGNRIRADADAAAKWVVEHGDEEN